MKTVTINNLKGISKLSFNIPEEKGVFLIAGANGCGKTTLLVCLDRITNCLAFATGFSRASSWDMADQYTSAKITYSIDKRQITYRKAKARWVAVPKKNSVSFLNEFGFASSIFIKADSNRIDVKQDDLQKGNLTSVDKLVKDALNIMFDTNKFECLYRLKNSNGRGKTPTYFYVIREGIGLNTKYYSEKRFSTGELAMVRLVEQVENSEKGSMVLLDEAELALHPKVQVNMLKYLNQKAIDKELRVFISTHSPTLLKEAKKENIYLLQDNNGEIEVINPCYPAYAIGDVDFDKSYAPDYVFFVEDTKAQAILREMQKRYVSMKPEHNTALCIFVPTGGFYETGRMAVYTQNKLLGNSKVYAVVDQDAVEDLDSKSKFKKLYEENNSIIRTLTFTPEQWFIEKIETAENSLKNEIKRKYCVDVEELLKKEAYIKCNSPKPRQLAKEKFSAFCTEISVSACVPKETIESEIISVIVDNLDDGELMRVMNPLFKD